MSLSNVEYWDLFDEKREFVGMKHKRGDKIPDGLFHLVVHSWIIDENGFFLISQRQRGRTDELLWERTGGSVLAGESSYQGALREVEEELGVDLSDCKASLIRTEKRIRYHDFFDAWLFIVNRLDLSIVPNKNEVCQYKWASLEELIKMREDGLLVSSSEYFEEVFCQYRILTKNDS